MLEVNIFDLHFGKLCWNGETGEDYDTKIASKRFHNAIDDIVGKAIFHDVDKIVFPVGNDFFNSDNLRNQPQPILHLKTRICVGKRLIPMVESL